MIHGTISYANGMIINLIIQRNGIFDQFKEMEPVLRRDKQTNLS